MILDASEFIPPQGYSWWWSAIGIALLVLIVLWFLGVWLFTRPRAARAVQPIGPPAPVLLEPLRDQYLRRLAQLEASWQAGEIDDRSAGLQLSTLMREYVDAVSGTATETMTLSDLQAHRFDGLGHAVAGLYPIAFPHESDGDIPGGFAAARQVVSTWK